MGKGKLEFGGHLFPCPKIILNFGNKFQGKAVMDLNLKWKSKIYQ